jgi:hypothetical protein
MTPEIKKRPGRKPYDRFNPRPALKAAWQAADTAEIKGLPAVLILRRGGIVACKLPENWQLPNTEGFFCYTPQREIDEKGKGNPTEIFRCRLSFDPEHVAKGRELLQKNGTVAVLDYDGIFTLSSISEADRPKRIRIKE